MDHLQLQQLHRTYFVCRVLVIHTTLIAGCFFIMNFLMKWIPISFSDASHLKDDGQMLQIVKTKDGIKFTLDHNAVKKHDYFNDIEQMFA